MKDQFYCRYKAYQKMGEERERERRKKKQQHCNRTDGLRSILGTLLAPDFRICVKTKQKSRLRIRAGTSLNPNTELSYPNTIPNCNVKQIWKFPSLIWKFLSLNWVVFFFIVLFACLTTSFRVLQQPPSPPPPLQVLDNNKPTGQTTVNKKAPIHYIIPINDTVHRPL